MGPASADRCDYPDYADKVARYVAAGGAERGILICGTGIGMAITADKVSGTVFLITPEELAQADKYEVSDYRRVLAPLASGGSAWAYVAQESGTGAA